MAMTLGGSIDQKPRDESTIEALTKRIGGIAETVAGNSSRIQQLLDRAFGPTPESGTAASNPRAVPSGALGALSERVDDLDSVCIQQRSLIAHLETIV